MSGLDWQALAAARAESEPFAYFHVANALTPDCAAALSRSFPALDGLGSYALEAVPPDQTLLSLAEDLESDRFRAIVGKLLDVDLTGKPTLVTLRGRTGARDGAIHTDSETKLATVLLYLNPEWTSREGRLRLLRSDSDLEDFAAEIPATMGSLVAFRRSDRSWHGHTRFDGERRVLQLNFLRSARHSLVGGLRHRLSAQAKQWFARA